MHMNAKTAQYFNTEVVTELPTLAEFCLLLYVPGNGFPCIIQTATIPI